MVAQMHLFLKIRRRALTAVKADSNADAKMAIVVVRHSLLGTEIAHCDTMEALSLRSRTRLFAAKTGIGIG